MRKLVPTLFFCLILGFCMTIMACAEDFVSEVRIPYVEASPMIDGVAAEGEYPGEAVVMNRASSETWVGSMSDKTSTLWYLAWDETGLYVFAEVQDDTPVYRQENSHWVGADCVEIGLNPGAILRRPDDKGVFFSMGATADGRVVVYRHNYDEKILSSEIRGCAVDHIAGKDRYTVEVCIPWSLILIEADCTKTDTHLNATAVVPAEDLYMDVVFAVIDAKDDSTIAAAYKLTGTDFVTGQYVPGMLLGARSEETETDSVSEGVTDPGLIIVPGTPPEETMPQTAETAQETHSPESDTSGSETGSGLERQQIAGYVIAIGIGVAILGLSMYLKSRKAK